MAEAKPTNQIFNASYVSGYEEASSGTPRMYEIGATALANRDAVAKQNLTVVEIGGGTGNSTAILAATRPDFEKIIVVEPSDDFLKIASYKFGKDHKPLDASISERAKAYIEEVKIKSRSHVERITLLQARAQDIPLESVIADRVYACNSWHWFSQDDASLSEINRVLAPGGKLFFDSTGAQFDFEDKTFEEKRINEIHVLEHPLHTKLMSYIQQATSEDGIEWTGPEQKTREFMFNLEFLKNRLGAFGFRLIPTEDGQPYLLTIVSKSIESLMDTLRVGPRMWSMFNNPPFENLSSEQKQSIVDRALQNMIGDYSDLRNRPSIEAFSTFAFEKNR